MHVHFCTYINTFEFAVLVQTLLDCEVALSDVFQVDDGEKDRISAPAQLCFKNLQDEFYARMSDDLNTSHLLTGAFPRCLEIHKQSF